MRRRRLDATRLVCSWLTIPVTIGIFSACSSSDERYGDVGPSVGVSRDGGTTAPATCEEGATKRCYVTVGEHNGVLTCYEGVSTCVGGVWGTCADGEVTHKTRGWEAPSGGGTIAISPATPCLSNPCDPSCMTYEEEPDASVVANTQDGGLFDWVGGSLADLPPGLVKGKGIIEPCEWGGHCQFNHHCTNVATDWACAHSKCATGDALGGACLDNDPCVEAICEADGSCCAVACDHDPCVTGTKLKATCDSCVTSICASMPSCCSTAWTQACVDAIATQCGGATCQCAGGQSSYGGHCYRYYPYDDRDDWADARAKCAAIGSGWDLAAITTSGENTFAQGFLDNVDDTMWIGLNDRTTEGVWAWSNGEPVSYTHWDSGDPDGGSTRDCVMLQGWDNNWDDDSCSDRRRFLCEGMGTVLAGSTAKAWDSSCVDMVQTVCDATCSTGTPPAAEGTCVPWLPGQTDPACGGIDLSLAVPCDDVVPVCNHGNTVAPAHIPLIHFPGNSPHYGTCDPTASPDSVYCETQEPIPPGHCINVDCNLWAVGVGSNRQIYVNPPGYAGSVDECSCLDNWTEAHKGNTCGAPECSGTVSQASIKPVNMYFMLDKSGSMGSCTAASKWTAARNAIKSFFESPDSGGMHVALEFFRLNQGEAESGDDGCGPYCSNARCANPLVPLGTLTDQPRPTDAHEQDLVYWLQHICPGGMTPTYPALGGALDWSIGHQNANPNEAHVVILVTDGEPTECNTSDTQIADLARDAYNQYGIRTYPIGMLGADFTALDLIALRGGTSQAIHIDSTNPANVEAELLAALQDIAGQALACSFDLPDVSLFDPNNAQVLFIAGDGTTTDLQQAQNEGACDAAHHWFYDDNASPTSITLCQDMCQTAQADPAGRVEVHLGCPTVYEGTVVTQVYAPECPPGTHVQWGYLAYDTTTPSDSTVVFAARTAETEALLTGPFTPVATAQAAPDTQVCPMTGSSGCPVDLYAALGTAAAFGSVLELQVTLNPSSTSTSSPTLHDWQITYSCPPSE